MARKSTELRVPRAVPLSALDKLSRSEMAEQFGASGAGELESRMRDRAYVCQRVAALPVLCSLMLEALVEAGGLMPVYHWRVLVRARSKADAQVLARAENLLFKSAFVVGTEQSSGQLWQVAVVSPASELLYDLLCGISLPSAPPPDDAAMDWAQRRRARDVMALCGLTAHRRVRFTQSGVPDRTTLKRFVKDLGVTIEDADAALRTAHAAGWLSLQAERAAPNTRALTEADRSVWPTAGTAVYATLIPEHGWVSREALVRCAVPSRQQDVLRSETDVLAIQPSLQWAEHAGQTWVRRAKLEVACGDGHVTPSFEVLLGPKAALGTVARVALCCELVRVDHVLTYKLTPESVAAGLGAGLTAEEIKAALSDVSPHGLPDNVAFMLQDWIAGTSLARVKRGLFIFADPVVAERLATELRAELVSRPQAGVLEVRGDTTDSVLDKALAKARVQLQASVPNPASTPALARPLPPHAHDAKLRKRVVQAQESGDFASDTPAPRVEEPLTATDLVAVPSMQTLMRVAREQRAPAALFDLLETCAKWGKDAAEPLRQWARRLRSPAREEAEAALGLPLAFLPWLSLSVEWRTRTLARAHSVLSLMEQATACFAHRERMREGGPQVLALLQQPKVNAAFRRAFETVARSAVGADAEFAQLLDDSELDDEFAQQLASRELDRLPPEARSLLDRRQSALARQPAPGELTSGNPGKVYSLLSKAIDDERIVHVQVSDKIVHSIVVEALRTRGKHNVVHCTELASMEPRVIKLSDIVAADYAEPAPETTRASDV